MISYERAIVDRLKGSTPKEKYNNLVRMQQLLYKLAFPARGTDDEALTIMNFAKDASKLVDQHGEY